VLTLLNAVRPIESGGLQPATIVAASRILWTVATGPVHLSHRDLRILFVACDTTSLPHHAFLDSIEGTVHNPLLVTVVTFETMRVQCHLTFAVIVLAEWRARTSSFLANTRAQKLHPPSATCFSGGCNPTVG
jgi:hypothetical protein